MHPTVIDRSLQSGRVGALPKGEWTRRAFLRGAAAGVAALTVGREARAASTEARPNIVFIMADDLGFADVGCYGRRDTETPHIDGLARDGVRLLQAYSNSAVCTATRVALITGRYQYRLRLGLEEPLVNKPEIGLPPAHPTLPSSLKKAGYQTALIGKWHLGALPLYGPLKSGYDEFYGFRGGAVDYYDHGGDLWDGDVPIERTGYMTELLGDRAVQFITEQSKRVTPFFLSLHFSAPHWPWEGPGDEEESKRLKRLGPGSLFHYDGGSQKTYRAMIEAMDYQIGRVRRALAEQGVAENTIIVFTSDNGGERFSDTWPFTGRKTDLLEGGLRVPAIISWPARLPRGVESEQVAISMDWVPTLFAAAQATAEPEYPLDGDNLLPQLEGTAPVTSRKLFWRYKANAQRAHRDGDFKYLKIRNHTYLFNVVEDPMERANLKDRDPATYQRLARQWAEWNKAMLPEIRESFTGSPEAKNVADRVGVEKMAHEPDPPPTPDP
jgi:arylsulfatase A-like enzyme